MKKLNILLVISLISIFACGGKNINSTNIDNANKDTADKIEQELEYIDDLSGFSFEDEFPNLAKILIVNEDMYATIKIYASMVVGEIGSEEKVLEILDLRYQILNDKTLTFVLEEYYFENEASVGYEYWDLVDNELKILGFQSIYAEGMFIDIDAHSFMEEQIEEYLSLEMKMYLKLNEAEANSRGGEYPYMGLEAYAEVILIGEDFINQFPNSDKKSGVEQTIFNALIPFTDYHKVVADGMETYCVDGLTYEFWPTATMIEFHDSFIKNNKDSKYFDVIYKIRQNTSSLSMDENYEPLPIYVVVTDYGDNYLDAKKITNNYLNNGIDIPHCLILNDNDKSVYVAAYRFFSNRVLANEAFEHISKTHKNAEIIKVNGNGEVIKN